jgi:hypothetical protein
MQCTPGGEKPLKVSPDGLTARLESPIVAKDPFSYGFALTDRKAVNKESFSYPPDVSHAVAVKADEPPTLELLTTGEQPAGKVEKKVALVFNAADDYGLSEARILWQVSDPEGKVSPKPGVWTIKTWKGKLPLQATERYVWKVKDAIVGLKPKCVVEYQVEVLDNRQTSGTGPNFRRSEKRRLEILSDEEYANRLADLHKQYMDRLKEVTDQERKAAEETNRLQIQMGGAATRPGANGAASRPAPLETDKDK